MKWEEQYDCIKIRKFSSCLRQFTR